MKSIEHLTGLLLEVSSAEAELRNELRQGARPGFPERLLASYDEDKAAALFATFRANHTWQVPTFMVLRPRDASMAHDPRLKYMPSHIRQKLWAPAARTPAPAQQALQRKVFERRLALVGDMHRAGVPILAGSDVLNPYIIPGFSLHEELQWLVKAGLSPMAALQSATRNAGIYLGFGDLGTVEAGKVADLVLLDADPLQDIRNSQSIAAVMARGKLHLRADLDRMLANVERIAQGN
jgi:imidazolonepropionase-like amidohydrolase